VWRLPKTTHSSLLPGISNTMPLIDLLYRHFLKFVYRRLSSRILLGEYAPKEERKSEREVERSDTGEFNVGEG